MFKGRKLPLGKLSFMDFCARMHLNHYMVAAVAEELRSYLVRVIVILVCVL